MTTIRAERLTADAFAPFGRVIQQPSREPDGSSDDWTWWEEIAALEPAERAYTVGYLDVRRPTRSFDWAERHLHSEELVVPVRGALLLHVGPPDQGDDPAPDAFRVFRVEPGDAVVLAKGVWHGAPLAVDSAVVLVGLLEGTGRDDKQIVRFGEVAVVEQS